MRAATLFTFLVTLGLLTVPAAQSSWSSAGDLEPNTPYDDATLMWPGPPVVGDSRVYFNVITQVAPGGAAGVSPNVAALGTRIESPTNEYHLAILGVWVDCNGDGYVGLAEQAAREYDAALLLDDSVCPSVTGLGNTWTQGAHNYNGWVSELVPIGRDPGPSDARIYADDDAMVWGDYGRPDQEASFQSCFLINLPRGTLQSTGGILNYAECRFEQLGVDGLGTFNDAMDLVGDPLALRGSDPAGDDWRTSGASVATFGTEDEAASPAYVWDCSAEDTFHSGDAYNSTGRPLDPVLEAGGLGSTSPYENTSVYGIAPALGGSAEPTVPALLNHTSEGATGDCDTSNDAGHDFYGLSCGGGGGGACLGEDDVNAVSKKNKREADWNMVFFQEARGTIPFGPALGNTGAGGAPGTTGGLAWTGVDGTGWYSTSYYASKLGFRTVKFDLNGDDPTSSTAGVADAWWLSFYAHVGPATTARAFALPGGSGVYGSAQCGDEDQEIRQGWNCDVDQWYLDPNGQPTPEEFPRARPQQIYELRDVDCYDGTVAPGVGVQPAYYGEAPCPS